jgi:exopolysaccharide production protein ExoZ
LLGVAWTLEYELLFYSIVAIAIVNLRCGIVAVLAWGIGIVAAAIWAVESFPLRFVLADYNFDFFLGMSAAALLRGRTIPRPSLVLPVLPYSSPAGRPTISSCSPGSASRPS